MFAACVCVCLRISYAYVRVIFHAYKYLSSLLVQHTLIYADHAYFVLQFVHTRSKRNEHTHARAYIIRSCIERKQNTNCVTQRVPNNQVPDYLNPNTRTRLPATQILGYPDWVPDTRQPYSVHRLFTDETHLCKGETIAIYQT